MTLRVMNYNPDLWPDRNTRPVIYLIRSLFPFRLAAGCMRGLIITSVLILTMLSSGLRAETMNITMPDTIVLPGDQIVMPVTVDTYDGHDSVLSGEFTLDYDRSLISVTSVATDGSLLEGSVSLDYNATTGRIAFASSEALTFSDDNDNILFYLTIIMDDDASGGDETNFEMQGFFNEGTPENTVVSGVIRSPGISVSPSSVTLIEGDSTRFSVSGDVHPPVTWSVSDSERASISQEGWLTGLQPGTIRVFVEDQIGLRDSTDLFRVQPDVLQTLTVSTPDTSVSQTRDFWWPVSVSDVTDLNITSMQFELGWSGQHLEFLALSTENSLLDDAGFGSVDYDHSSGSLSVAAAGVNPPEGSGPLIWLQFRVRNDASGNRTPEFSTLMFNEDIDPDFDYGTISILDAPEITLTEELIELVTGDTATISVETGGTSPFNWQTTNEDVVTIDEQTGEITAAGSGTAEVFAIDDEGFTSSSSEIVVHDINASLENITLFTGLEAELPVIVDDVSGLGIFSYEMEIALDTTMLDFQGLETGETISEGMSVSSNISDGMLKIAAAGTEELQGEGQLLKLVFSEGPEASAGSSAGLYLQQLTFNDPGLPGAPTALLHDGIISFSDPDDPSVPVLVQPEDDALEVELTPEFAWEGELAETYDLQIATDRDFSNLVAYLNDIESETYTLEMELEKETTYWWRVRGVNFQGTSNWSGPRSFTTIQEDDEPSPVPPEAPQLAFPDNGAADVETAVILRWYSVAEADSYRVQLSAHSDFSELMIDQVTVSDTTYNVSDLDYMTDYYWQVRAYSDSLSSEWSDTFSFQTVMETFIEATEELPSSVTLHQNYPNPFNPVTTITYALPSEAEVKLEIFTVTGQRIGVPVNRRQTAGYHSVEFDAAELSSGIYLYRLTAGQKSITRQMTIIK